MPRIAFDSCRLPRVAQAVLLASVLLFQTSAWALDKYKDRPTIESIPAAVERLSDVERLFRHRYFTAMIRMNANVVGMLRKRHAFFLGRDGEFFYDFVRISNRESPELLERVHLINVSRAIYQDPSQHALLLRYLEQEGFLAVLERGEDVVLIDTGWRGHMIREIIHLLRVHYKDNPKILSRLRVGAGIKVQFALATRKVEEKAYPEGTVESFQIPSSRAFLASLEPSGNRVDPVGGNVLANRARIKRVENRVPHYTRGATRFDEEPGVDGKPSVIDAVCDEESHELPKVLAKIRDMCSEPDTVMTDSSRHLDSWEKQKTYGNYARTTGKPLRVLGHSYYFWSDLVAQFTKRPVLDTLTRLGDVILEWNKASHERDWEQDALEELEDAFESFRIYSRESARLFMADARAFAESEEGTDLHMVWLAWWRDVAGLIDTYGNKNPQPLIDFLKNTLDASVDTVETPVEDRGRNRLFAEAAVRDVIDQLEISEGWGARKSTGVRESLGLARGFDGEKIFKEAKARIFPERDYISFYSNVAKASAGGPLQFSASMLPGLRQIEGDRGFEITMDLLAAEVVDWEVHSELVRLGELGFRNSKDGALRNRWVDLVGHRNVKVALAVSGTLTRFPTRLSLVEARRLVEYLKLPSVVSEPPLRGRLLTYAVHRLQCLREVEWASFFRELEASYLKALENLPPNNKLRNPEGTFRENDSICSALLNSTIS